MAAKRLESFEFEPHQPARRYDWPRWTDGSAWQIERGDDYDVSTENMRVNLHMKAKQLGVKVRTSIVREGDTEGLRFQFYEPDSGAPSVTSTAPPSGDSGSDGAALEKHWHAEMLQIHADAKAIGYNASYFIQMVGELGGLAAAKQLIQTDKPSDGFIALWERHRLDISVEARTLKPEFRPLFSETELAKCRKRLSDYEWRRKPPWMAP